MSTLYGREGGGGVPPHLLEIDGAGAVAERDKEVHGERHHADAREDGHEAPDLVRLVRGEGRGVSD